MADQQIRLSIADGKSALLLASVRPTPIATINGLVVINPDGSNISSNINWDLITPTFATLTDTYVFSLLGVTQKTITVTYTDATKDVLLSVTKA